MNTINNTHENKPNVDPAEIEQFDSRSARWWDPNSEFKPLHDINPLRLDFILSTVDIADKHIVDVGCGGGILSESMATKMAIVTGIDLGKSTLDIAKLHSLESKIEVDYQQISAEDFAQTSPESFDVVTCMEMLEHVPDPSSVIAACAKLTKPGGHVFFSTISRTPKSYFLAIIAAEYVLNMLPKGTHDYKNFIRPSELDSWARDAGFELVKLSGIQYNPLTSQYSLSHDVNVNYMAAYIKPNIKPK